VEGVKVTNGNVEFLKEYQLAVLDRSRVTPGIPTVDLQNPANNPENVQRVMRVVSEQDFNYLFPVRASSYIYIDFLRAFVKFPAICSQKGPYETILTLDEICKKEIATIFAHNN
jgi:chitodextrinase